LSRVNFRCGRARYLLARAADFFVFADFDFAAAADRGFPGGSVRARLPFDLGAAGRGALLRCASVNRVWSAIVW
jgi:hypothetical protein